MSETMCRGCYAARLSADELERFNSEPATSCIYLCADHQKALDGMLASLPLMRLMRAKNHPAAFSTPPAGRDGGEGS